jgi:hypothetical protein
MSGERDGGGLADVADAEAIDEAVQGNGAARLDVLKQVG